MKYYNKTLILLLLVLSINTLLCCSSKRLSSGKDTQSIINDRYTVDVINNFLSENKSESEWILIDRFPKEYPPSPKNKSIEETDVIEKEITALCDKKPYIYMIGYNGYSKFNYETGELLQSQEISYFSDDDEILFNQMVDGTLECTHYKSK